MSKKSKPLTEQSASRLKRAISSVAVGLIILSTNEFFFENEFVQIVAIICFILAMDLAFIDLSKNQFNSILHHLIFGVAASLLAVAIQINVVWSFPILQGTFLYNLFRFGIGSQLIVALIASLFSVWISANLSKRKYLGNLWLATVTIFVSFAISFVGFSPLP